MCIKQVDEVCNDLSLMDVIIDLHGLIVFTDLFGNRNNLVAKNDF